MRMTVLRCEVQVWVQGILGRLIVDNGTSVTSK